MSDSTNSPKNLQDELRDSAHRIWLAGLGALAQTAEEGSKMFERLVSQGRDYESRGRNEAQKQYEGAKSSADDLWSSWSDKLDETVTRALQRMGVPSRDEIRNLTQRVEELNAKVEMLKPRTTPAGTGATGGSTASSVTSDLSGGLSGTGSPVTGSAATIVDPTGEPLTGGTPVTPGTTAPTLDVTDPAKIIA